MPDPVDERLVVYGTLAPGRSNHHQMAGMDGTWRPCVVRGTLLPQGWGAALGYPGIILQPDGPEVDALVFESADLPDHWARLDAFEGPGYRRVTTEVNTDGRAVVAWVYELTETPDT